MKLLIVDDDSDLLEVLAEILINVARPGGGLPFEPDEIRTASTFGDALAIARQVEIDLALLDFELDGHRGDQLALELAKIRPIRVAFHTGHPEWKPIGNLARQPIVAKPSTPEALVAALDRAPQIRP